MPFPPFRRQRGHPILLSPCNKASSRRDDCNGDFFLKTPISILTKNIHQENENSNKKKEHRFRFSSSSPLDSFLKGKKKTVASSIFHS